MKKILNISLLVITLLITWVSSFATDFKQESLLINDDRIFSLGNKYTSMISALFEEETARLGLTGYHYNISKRDIQTEVNKMKALNSLKASLEDIKPASLSTYAQADYYTLKELVNLKAFNTEIRRQFEVDPMWYLEPIETIYELLIKDFLPAQERFDYALKRLEAIPDILADAEDNLTNPSELNLRLTIEKIDMEVNNMKGLTTLFTKISNDKQAKRLVNSVSKTTTAALNKYKAFLQKKLAEDDHVDFRLGDNNYEYLFQEVYMLPTKYSKVESTLQKNLNQSKKDLIKWITPRVLVTLTDKEIEERAKKEEKAIHPRDYYLLAKKNTETPVYDKVLKTYSNEVKKADQFFVTKKLFPNLSLPIVIRTAPPVFRAMPSKVTVYPPVPLPETHIGDILVSLPQKATLNKADFILNYNYSQIKFSAAEYITPGETLIYSVEPANLSLLSKISDDMFYIHGWIKYALDTAYENNFFETDEDKLNYLWFNYQKAVYALVDYRLQTKDFDLESALNYMKEAGIEEKEAKKYLDYVALSPFDAVSYIIGAQEFKRLRIKYKKQLKDSFDLLTFHTKVLSVGRIPLIALEKTLERTYEKKNVESYFNMTYF